MVFVLNEEIKLSVRKQVADLRKTMMIQGVGKSINGIPNVRQKSLSNNELDILGFDGLVLYETNQKYYICENQFILFIGDIRNKDAYQSLQIDLHRYKYLIRIAIIIWKRDLEALVNEFCVDENYLRLVRENQVMEIHREAYERGRDSLCGDEVEYCTKCGTLPKVNGQLVCSKCFSE